MSEISTSFIPSSSANLDLRHKQQNHIAGTSDFDALLSSASSKLGMNASQAADYLSVCYNEFAGDFIGNITSSLNYDVSSITSQDLFSNTFPFSEGFNATFGTKGPLIDFINMITSNLQLTSAQNQALQEIAVRNKDITYTPANVQQIAQELQQAGIA